MGIFIEPKTLPDDAGGFVQLLFLLAVYGKILMSSSHMISEGSELLLLVPALAGVVGSVVLPVLGAVPDGAIVLFSGMGENAQEELTIGVGALAGSTIMLLTVPWFLSIFGGRVHLDPVNQQALYKRPAGASLRWSKVPTKWNMNYNGIGITPPVRVMAVIMLVSCVNYLVIQIPAFVYASDPSLEKLAKHERPWAMVGLVTSMLSFVAYLLYQWKISSTDEVKNDKIAEITLKNVAKGNISLLGALGPEFEAALREHHAVRNSSIGAGIGISGSGAGAAAQDDYGATADLMEPHPVKSSVMERLRLICRPFFHKYDADKTGTIDHVELGLLFADLGEALEPDEIRFLVDKYDKDKDGHLDIHEFLELVIDHSIKILHEGHHHERRPSAVGLTDVRTDSAGHGVAETEEEIEEEDEEEVPHDLKDLPWPEQQKRLKLRSFYMMFVGTVMILVFSDPMVAVLSEIGSRTGIPAFYISFVMSPIVSNGAEVIAAFAYSKKKSSKTISVSLATLLGAATMNASFVIFIFLLLIYVKRLAWTFSAETISILVVQTIVGLMALSKTQNLWSGVFILSLYPLSLILVYILENVLGFD